MANKTDMDQRRVISPKQGQDFAQENGLEFFECSAVSLSHFSDKPALYFLKTLLHVHPVLYIYCRKICSMWTRSFCTWHRPTTSCTKRKLNFSKHLAKIIIYQTYKYSQILNLYLWLTIPSNKTDLYNVRISLSLFIVLYSVLP